MLSGETWLIQYPNFLGPTNPAIDPETNANATNVPRRTAVIGVMYTRDGFLFDKIRVWGGLFYRTTQVLNDKNRRPSA